MERYQHWQLTWEQGCLNCHNCAFLAVMRLLELLVRVKVPMCDRAWDVRNRSNSCLDCGEHFADESHVAEQI